MRRLAQTHTTLGQILIGVFVFLSMNLVVVYLAQKCVPYNTRGFPYKDFVDQYNLPLLLQPLANFDGAQYIIIAADKYFTYQQAYFPLYPILIRLFAPLYMRNHAITGIILSLVSFVGGLFVFNKLADLIYPETSHDKHTLHPVILLLLVLPCSFFFLAVYTESLFLLLASGTMYFLFKRRPILAGVFGYLASLTRFAGVLLLIPIGVEVLFHHKKYSAIEIGTIVGSFRMAIEAVRSFAWALTGIENERQDYEYLEQFLGTKPLVDQTDAHPITITATPEIMVDQVSFSYPRAKKVALDECHLTIHPGLKRKLVTLRFALFVNIAPCVGSTPTQASKEN
jgi:Gpi18-like mannosyltransferase